MQYPQPVKPVQSETVWPGLVLQMPPAEYAKLKRNPNEKYRGQKEEAEEMTNVALCEGSPDPKLGKGTARSPCKIG